ncbi:MAG: Biopolymer transport protein ExbB [Alphaproteobacteria bacterium MarineAlpha5_Bin12]|nr:protein TolQ [Pelagibacteraceae bacterium]PPR41132.1 MAG: Biopolymer transport protein ExbB [Alphaproteobacteria bacterium MarineAlpha5_Bin12]|tara:strand:- start:1191 stop:1913 length:723 start_codon:yes stop_codon:yes gene_type:complete
MESSLVETVDLATNSLDFSFLTLFLRADWVVKSVIIILILASVWSWTVIVSKLIRIKKINFISAEFEELFWSGNSLEDLYDTLQEGSEDPKVNVFCAGMEEWKKSKKKLKINNQATINSLKERMTRSMNSCFSREIESVEKNLTFLATAGSTAPFVGLFGTVWGIMNSFQSIAIAQNTNLAVVAPGIAEALFATALGLFVAIPSVVAFNKISSDINKVSLSIEDFMNEFTTIFFRQLEQA